MSGENNCWKEFGQIAFIVLLIGSILEIGILAYAYLNADKVECNFLWCTFTKSNNYFSQNDTVIIKSHKTCFYNGYKIDCNNSLNLETISTDGNFDNKPIFEYADEWVNILESKQRDDKE